MSFKKGEVFIPVDKDWAITIDPSNWMVTRIRKVKDDESKNYGKVYYVQETFHHNLSDAIERIVKNKTERGEADTSSLSAYLAWHESTIHSLADRVLSQKKLLQEALEFNGVM